MGKGVSPQRVHGYRYHSTEDSWVKVSVQRVFMGTGVSLQCSWIQVSVQRGFMGKGVSPQRVHGYWCQSTEDSWVKVLAKGEFLQLNFLANNMRNIGAVIAQLVTV